MARAGALVSIMVLPYHARALVSRCARVTSVTARALVRAVAAAASVDVMAKAYHGSWGVSTDLVKKSKLILADFFDF